MPNPVDKVILPIPVPPRFPFPLPDPIPDIAVFFEEKFNSAGDDDIKKVVTAGNVIKQKLENPQNPLSTEEITHIADGGVSAVKVMYKVGTGEMDPMEAVDEMIDRGAAVLGTVVKTTCEKVGEKAGAAVGGFIGKIFGPAGVAAGMAIGAKIGGFAGKIVGEIIVPAVKKVATFAKEVIHTAWEGVKSVASAAWEGIKSFGREIASFFGF